MFLSETFTIISLFLSPLSILMFPPFLDRLYLKEEQTLLPPSSTFSLSKESANMVFENETTPSNLDSFLQNTTPVVRSQFLPKVRSFNSWVCFVYQVSVVVMIKMCFFLFRVRLRTSIGYGIHGRERKLTISRCLISGIATTNGARTAPASQLS